MGAPEVSAFLEWLAMRQRISASTQNQALCALLFLYREVLRLDIGAIQQVPRARTPTRLPVVLSRDEVGRLLKALTGTDWIIVALLYGAGFGCRTASVCASRTWTSISIRSWSVVARARRIGGRCCRRL
jgi:integrase